MERLRIPLEVSLIIVFIIAIPVALYTSRLFQDPLGLLPLTGEDEINVCAQAGQGCTDEYVGSEGLTQAVTDVNNNGTIRVQYGTYTFDEAHSQYPTAGVNMENRSGITLIGTGDRQPILDFSNGSWENGVLIRDSDGIEVENIHILGVTGGGPASIGEDVSVDLSVEYRNENQHAFDIIVTNNSSTPIPAVNVAVYLDPDPIPPNDPPADAIIFDVAVGGSGIEPGDSDIYTYSLAPEDIAPGQHEVYAWVNRNGAISDINPGNDISHVTYDAPNPSTMNNTPIMHAIEQNEDTQVIQTQGPLLLPNIEASSIQVFGEVSGARVTVIFTNTGNSTIPGGVPAYIWVDPDTIFPTTSLAQQSTSLPMLAPEDSYSWSVVFPYTQIGQVEDHIYGALVDWDIDETNEDDNSIITEEQADPPPDPATSPDLELTNIRTNLRDDGFYEFIMEVENIGAVEAANFEGMFYIDPNPPPPQPVTSSFFENATSFISPVTPNLPQEWTVSIHSSNLPTGTYSVYAFVDSSDVIGEPDETNNIFNLTFSTGANISVSGFDINVNPNNVEVTGVISNTGNTVANGIGLDLYIDPQTMPPATPVNAAINEHAEISLNAGDNYTWTVTLPISDFSPGSHTFVIFADSADTLSEIDEDDNIQTLTAIVGETPEPALGGFAALHEIQSTPPSQQNQLRKITIKNSGTTSGDGSWVNAIETNGYVNTKIHDVHIVNNVGYSLAGIGESGTGTTAQLEVSELLAEGNTGGVYASFSDIDLTNSIVKGTFFSGLECGAATVDPQNLDESTCNVTNTVFEKNARYYCADLANCDEVTANIQVNNHANATLFSNIFAGKNTTDPTINPVRFGLVDMRPLHATAGEPQASILRGYNILYDFEVAQYAEQSTTDPSVFEQTSTGEGDIELALADEYEGVFRAYGSDYRIVGGSIAEDADSTVDPDESVADIGAFGGENADWEPMIVDDTTFSEPDATAVCGIVGGEIIDYNTDQPVRIIIEDRSLSDPNAPGGFTVLAQVTAEADGAFSINLADYLPSEYTNGQPHLLGLRALNWGILETLEADTLGSFMHTDIYSANVTCILENEPPRIISGSGPIHVTEGSTYNPAYEVVAEDGPNDLAGASLTYGFSGDCPGEIAAECAAVGTVPTGVTFDPATREISYTVPDPYDFGGEDSDTFDILVWVYDGEFYATQLVTFVVHPNDISADDPLLTISHTCPADQTFVVGTQINCHVSAEVIPSEWTVSSLDVTFAPDPSWLSAPAGTLEFDITGTSELSDVGVHTITITAIAGDGTDTITEVVTFDITIVEEIQANQAPVCTTQTVSTLYIGDTFNISPVATDPNGDTLVFTPTSGTIPVGAILNGPSFSWTPSTGQEGTYQSGGDFLPIVIVASDMNGGVTMCQYELTVIAEPAATDITVIIEYELLHKISLDTYPLTQGFDYEIREEADTTAPVITGTIGVATPGVTNSIASSDLTAGVSYILYVKPTYYLAQTQVIQPSQGSNTITMNEGFIPGDWNDDTNGGSPNLVNTLDYAVHKQYRTLTDLTQLFDPNGEHPVSARDYAIYSLYLQVGGADPLQ